MGRGELEFENLILVTLALVAFGIVCVYSATSAPAAVGGGNPNSYMERQAALRARRDRADGRRAALGLPAAARGRPGARPRLARAAPRRPRDRPGPERRPPLAARSARPLFQPSELAKLALAVWAAAYLSRKPPPRSLRELARPVGLLDGDLRRAASRRTRPRHGDRPRRMLAAVLLVAGRPRACSAGAAAIVCALGAIMIYAEPYQRARLLTFLHPWRDPQGAGFQTVQAQIGMGSGGIFGVGLGNGIAKLFYLPEAPTDMMFANIGEELGLIGASLVIFAYAVFAYAGLRIALGCRDPFGKRLAVALTMLVCGQADRQHRGGDGARAADRNPAPVPLLRRLEPRRAARRGRDPP